MHQNPLLVNMVTAGKLGLKSGEGFYDYSDGLKTKKVGSLLNNVNDQFI